MTRIAVLLYNTHTNKYDQRWYDTDSASVDDLGILHVGPKEAELAWFNNNAWHAVDRVVEPEEPEETDLEDDDGDLGDE